MKEVATKEDEDQDQDLHPETKIEERNSKFKSIYLF